MKSIQLYLVFSLIILFDSCLEQVRSNGIELTAPLAESGKESALLKSRKRIVPNHKNVHIPTQQIPTLAETDLHQDFINERLKVSLDCKPDSMRLYFNFTEPFRGLVSVGKNIYSNPVEARDCGIRGFGSYQYRLDISHLNCGTKFDNKCGQFTNTLFVRYHPSLETGGDYSKTLVCKFGLSSISVH